MDRRRFTRSAFAGAIILAAAWAAPALLTTGRPTEGAGVSALDAPLFSHDQLVEHARSLSTRPYQAAERPEDPALNMSYDQYRSIAFDREQAVWSDLEGTPFTLEPFHPGFIFPTPVEISLVDAGGRVTPMAFDPGQFTYGGLAVPPVGGAALGYSGFRAHAPINDAEIWDEFAVFQGATYFRGVGRGQAYGLSARGLALATGEPQGEEFPFFTKFWVEQPAPGDMALVVHALLDSPSVAGAYRFTVTPGDTTVMDVDMTLFPRAEIASAGLAPLTSMFLFDQTNRWGFDDFRNAVHDSDGLQIMNGAGELIWRPLANPRRLQISAFVDDGPRGFGLMQRKRNPGEFNDFNARYEDRPSLWVEPVGDWGQGSVVLVEIPTERESNDNIAAFWRPAAPMPAGQPFAASYRLYWGADAPIGSTMMRVTHTRTGASIDSGARFFAVDFDGAEFDVPVEALTADLTSTGGVVSAPHLERDPQSGTIRATFELDPENQDLVEMRVRLLAGGAPVSETWLYRWTRS